jgi:hypothetical protein
MTGKPEAGSPEELQASVADVISGGADAGLIRPGTCPVCGRSDTIAPALPADPNAGAGSTISPG